MPLLLLLPPLLPPLLLLLLLAPLVPSLAMLRLPQLLLNVTFAVVAWGQSSANTTTFTNPILSKGGADPWVIRDHGWYYMTYTTNDDVTLLRSQHLTCVARALAPSRQPVPYRNR